MAPTAKLVRDEQATRWFRRLMPVAVLLGILLLLMMPGLVLEKPAGQPDDAPQHPLARIALPER